MQNNRLTYRFLSGFLALLIFFTSVGFSVDLHYCMGELKTVNFVGKAKSCHDSAAKIVCPHHQKVAATKKGCCKNKTQMFQIDQDKNLEIAELPVDFQFQSFTMAFATVFVVDVVLPKQQIANFYYQNPIFSRDTYALLQRYLF